MKNEACTVDRFSWGPPVPAGTGGPAARLFAEGRAVVATGGASCTRALYDKAAAMGAEDQFFWCPLSREDYILGTAGDKLLETIQEALECENVSGVLIYASCLDILSQLDFEAVIRRVDNSRGVPVKVFLRGPLMKRRQKPEALAGLLRGFPPGQGRFRRKKKELPPLYPDFAGICGILLDWDLHNFMVTAGGCGGAIPELGRQEDYRLSHSRLDDVQIALGCEGLLTNGILADAKAEDREATALISTTTLTFLGFDDDALAEKLTAEGVRSVALPATGFDPGPAGVSEALLRLGRAFLRPAPKQPDRVNILGYDPLLLGPPERIAHGIEHLERRGLTCTRLGTGGLKEVETAAGAAMNWVVTAEGLALARDMEKRFGVPYLPGIPVGMRAMLRWRKEVNRLTGRDDEALETPVPVEPAEVQPRLLILGEPMLTAGVSAFLRDDLGLTDARLCVYDPTGGLEALYREDYPQLVYFRNADQLRALAETTDGILGDPLYRGCLPDFHGAFVPLPDPLVSGGKWWDSLCPIFGKKGGAYLQNALKEILS